MYGLCEDFLSIVLLVISISSVLLPVCATDKTPQNTSYATQLCKLYEQHYDVDITIHKIVLINIILLINVKLYQIIGLIQYLTEKVRLHLSNNVHIIVTCRINAKSCRNIFCS